MIDIKWDKSEFNLSFLYYSYKRTINLLIIRVMLIHHLTMMPPYLFYYFIIAKGKSDFIVIRYN